MNVSWNPPISCRRYQESKVQSSNSPLFFGLEKTQERNQTGFGPTLAANYAKTQQEDEGTQKKTEHMRALLRALSPTYEKQENPWEPLWDEKVGENDGEEPLLPSNKYNYKEVSEKIHQAKNAQSAGQAVLAAKRKVMEIKRKLGSGSKDTEELLIALAHAKRMEIVAKRKQNHLELEELVVSTHKQDEKQEQMEKTVQSAATAAVELEQEKLAEAADDIFQSREDAAAQVEEYLEESGDTLSEDTMADLNSAMAEIGEEELQQLEEAMELVDAMEIVNPHMSKEALEELKVKHRTSEEREMVKADMEYLKDLMELRVPTMENFTMG